jgi:fumarylacetoacetase
MPITANDTNRKSWLVHENSDFQFKTFLSASFLTKENVVTVGTRIGDSAIDLGALQQMGYFAGIELTDDMFMQDTLNDFISEAKNMATSPKPNCRNFDKTNSKLR